MVCGKNELHIVSKRENIEEIWASSTTQALIAD
jgi:hypothetical protein